jgi:hypothetical protein
MDGYKKPNYDTGSLGRGTKGEEKTSKGNRVTDVRTNQKGENLWKR